MDIFWLFVSVAFYCGSWGLVRFLGGLQPED